jgi:hypothetical protein
LRGRRRGRGGRKERKNEREKEREKERENIKESDVCVSNSTQHSNTAYRIQYTAHSNTAHRTHLSLLKKPPPIPLVGV